MAAEYERLRDLGLEYNGVFCGLVEAWQGHGEALGRVRLPVTAADGEFHVHPALLDACTHVCALALPLEEGIAFLPFAMQRVWLGDCPQVEEAWSHVVVTQEGKEVVTVDVWVSDLEGHAVAQLCGLALKRAPREAFLRQLGGSTEGGVVPEAGLTYEVVWQRQDGRSVVAGLPGQRVAVLCSGDVLKWQALVVALQGMGWRSGVWAITDVGLEGARVALALAAEELGELHHVVVDHEEPLGTSLCELLLAVVQAAVADRWLGRLWVLGRTGQPVEAWCQPVAVRWGPALGLRRVAAQEHSELGCTMVDVGAADGVEALLYEMLRDASGVEGEVAWREGTRYVPRLERSGAMAEALLGGSGAWQWARGPKGHGWVQAGGLMGSGLQPGDGNVRISLEAASVTVRDTLEALGLAVRAAGADGGPLRGGAGVVESAGDRVQRANNGEVVMALLPAPLGTHAIVEEQWLWRKPRWMTSEEAACWPVPFITAGCCLLGRCVSGLGAEDWKGPPVVLVQLDEAGLQMAALQLARCMGLEVVLLVGESEDAGHTIALMLLCDFSVLFGWGPMLQVCLWGWEEYRERVPH